jgi:undecaprenyl-diphosphatase
LPALRALLPRLVAIAALAVGFQVLTIAVSVGWMNTADHEVEQAMATAWDPPLHPLFQGIAILGGVEFSTIVLIALVIFLWRRFFVADAFVFVAFLAAEVFEILYKSNLTHPRPPASVAHTDGPSITNLLEPAAGLHNSFPSGHMMRTVLVYGLLAFVVRRLAPWPWLRNLAVPLAIVLIVVMAFDRLYLEVHWESDVLGGILLGAIALVSATVWLDRPQRADN